MTALGIYAIISHSDILAAVILFMIAALAIPLGVIQIWPEIKIHIRQSLLVGISIFICLLLVLSSLIGTSFLFPSPAVRVFPPLRVLFPTSQKIRIAVDMPLSGRSKSDGKSIADGAHFAIDQANKTNMIPGYTLEYVEYDDTGPNGIFSPEVGVQNMTTAIDDGLTGAIIGPMNSSVAAKAIPVTNQAPIALISPATTNPCLTKIHETDCADAPNLPDDLRPPGPVTFSPLPATDDLQAKDWAQYLREKKSYHTAYIIYDINDLYSNGFASAFIKEWQAAGGTFVAPAANEPAPGSIARYEKLLRQLPVAPDVIFFAGTIPGATYARQAVANIPDLNKTAFLGGGGIVEDSFATTIGRLGVGPVFGSVPLVDTSRRQFRTDYEAAGYTNYRPYTAGTYDCTMIVVHAIKAVLASGIQPPRGSWDQDGAKVFRQAVIDSIAQIHYDGVTGSHQFNADGDSTNEQRSNYQLVDSTWTLLQP